MKPHTRWFIGIPILMLVYSLLLLSAIFPFHPKTVTGWTVLIILAVPLGIAGELLGELALGGKFLKRWPSPFRIIYGVIALSIFLAVIMGVLYLAQPLMGKW